jgi:hypothetical protein
LWWNRCGVSLCSWCRLRSRILEFNSCLHASSAAMTPDCFFVWIVRLGELWYLPMRGSLPRLWWRRRARGRGFKFRTSRQRIMGRRLRKPPFWVIRRVITHADCPISEMEHELNPKTCDIPDRM